MRTVFVLENDYDILFVLTSWLNHEEYNVHGFSSPLDLLQILPDLVPVAIIVDLHTLRMNKDNDFCQNVRLIHNYPNPIILLSTYPIEDNNPLLCFVDLVIMKPFDLQEVSNAITFVNNLES